MLHPQQYHTGRGYHQRQTFNQPRGLNPTAPHFTSQRMRQPHLRRNNDLTMDQAMLRNDTQVKKTRGLITRAGDRYRSPRSPLPGSETTSGNEIDTGESFY